ncbi:MAG: phage major capsid protein [Anaerolineales bacterium]|nr:phage major capsid protein [Anaerolineales bacterium]
MKTVKELQEQVNAKRAEIAKIYEGKATTVDGEARYDLTIQELEEVRQKNRELDALAIELENAREADEMFKKNQAAIREAGKGVNHLPLGGEPKGRREEQREVKTLGQMFVESDAYQKAERKKDINFSAPDFDFLEAKTLMETGAGFAPQSIRTGRVVEYAHRRPLVADLIPQTPTEYASVVYMEETTFTNNAAPRAEGGQAGESALAYTERSKAVREIAHFLPVTEIQLEDVDGVRAIIDNRLLTMLDLVEETQLLTGDDNAPNLGGFLTLVTQAQAKGADPVPDAIYKAMTKVRTVGFTEPSAYITHPNDWQDVRLLRTTDGIYIWGNPSEAGPERIWGLPVVQTTAETENTGLLGDFQLYSEIRRRRGANIKVSDSHSDFFIKGKLAIRADKRLALVIYRLTAFCKVTGI